MADLFGVDYAASGVNTLALKKAAAKQGKSLAFVCRYLSTPGNPKNLTAPELFEIRSAGLAVVLVFETTAHRALDGRLAGVQDAKSAQAQATLIGLSEAPIYFAVDFDGTGLQQSRINGYLTGAASVLGKDKTGVYGGYYVVKRALDAGVCKYAWQTYAWSGGQWDSRARLRQYQNAQTLAGVSVDFDLAVAPDYGQTDPPKRVRTPASKLRLERGYLAWARWRLGKGDWKGWPRAERTVRPRVPKLIPAAWWRRLAARKEKK